MESNATDEGEEARHEGGGDVTDDWVLQSELHIAAYKGDLGKLLELLKISDVDLQEENGRTPLMYAAMADQLESVEMLLKHSALTTAQDANGQTPVHWAALTGSYKCLKLLLAQAPEAGLKDNDGRAPLHLATSHTSSKCLSVIVRRMKAQDLNEADNERMTALHWSAYNNTAENVRLLLKAGADIVVTDMDGKTALHWTANNPDDSTVRTLLELAPMAINLKDHEGRTALHLGVAAGNVPVVGAFISSAGVRCDLSAVDLQFRTPLHWAAVLGLSEIVGMLLEKGADPNAADAVGATALHYAAQKNHMECVSVLLSFAGVQDQPDVEGRTALMWAAQRGNYNVLKAMLEREVDIHVTDRLGATALHAAALSGHANCVQLLIQHGAPVDIADYNGHTPLFRACERGHTEVVVLLLRAGAMVELVDGSGRSCLHWAASGGHSVICSSLLHHGLPVDCTDSGGRTALHCTAYGGFTDCISVLLEAGVNVSLQDSEGITALHWACSMGHMDTVQILLGAGASPNVMEVDGERLTPLDYAIIGQHQALAQFLIEQGALSISGIRELAAGMIQRCVRGHLARKRVALLRQQRAEEGGAREEEVERVASRVVSAVSSGKERRSEAVVEGEPGGRWGDGGVREERSLERRKALESRLLEAGQQMQKLQSWSATHLRGIQSDIVQREKERVSLYRQKTKAALVIQLAWRKYIRWKHQMEAIEAQRRAMQRGGQEWQRELAALVIQLAWRQYLRRKLLRQSLRRQRVLHEWTPSVLAARQRALVAKVYGQELRAVHYDAPKPKPMVRPAYLHFIPSPAALSFNFAVAQYQSLPRPVTSRGMEVPHSLLAATS